MSDTFFSQNLREHKENTQNLCSQESTNFIIFPLEMKVREHKENTNFSNFEQFWRAQREHRKLCSQESTNLKEPYSFVLKSNNLKNTLESTKRTQPLIELDLTEPSEHNTARTHTTTLHHTTITTENTKRTQEVII